MPSLMESIVTLDVGAQEPWPNDVKLYQPYAMEQILLPDNANCLSVQAYLHMCGLPFRIEHRANAEFMSPSGKVPFIKCGAFVVSELEPIVQFVANKGISLSEELSADQKSDLRAYMSIIYTVLMNAELYICWCDKRTYNEVTKIRNGSVYPWPLNHFQTWSKRSAVIRKLKVLGWYQKTLQSVYQEVENCCQALSERLDGKEFFFGSKPTQLDAYLYGHVFAIISSPEYSSELISIIMKYPNLISHCKRICTNYVYNTSINFSELMEPVTSASKFIVDKNICTYEIKPKNQVTEVTRYLKYLNSDTDLSELSTNDDSAQNISTSNGNIKRTSSFTDLSLFEHQQEEKEPPPKPKEKYQSLSKSDQDYLTNLFCADKPQHTEVKFINLKSSKLSETSLSSLDFEKEEMLVTKITSTCANFDEKDSMSKKSLSAILDDRITGSNKSELSTSLDTDFTGSKKTLLSSNFGGDIFDSKKSVSTNLDAKISDSKKISSATLDGNISSSKKSLLSTYLDGKISGLKNTLLNAAWDSNISGSKESLSVDENISTSKKSLLCTALDGNISDSKKSLGSINSSAYVTICDDVSISNKSSGIGNLDDIDSGGKNYSDISLTTINSK